MLLPRSSRTREPGCSTPSLCPLLCDCPVQPTVWLPQELPSGPNPSGGTGLRARRPRLSVGRASVPVNPHPVATSTDTVESLATASTDCCGYKVASHQTLHRLVLPDPTIHPATRILLSQTTAACDLP